MAAQTTSEARNHDSYTVGWVCALSEEQTAATAMLDPRHANLLKPPNDPNAYTLGSIGKHNIVIACLPEGETGTNSAATIATWMISTFPLIKFGLMVGIGGGIPPKVRLGDVVVSTPADQYPGVVQWDFGKAERGGNFKWTGALAPPPTLLRTALTALKTENELNGSKIPEYLDELEQKWPRLKERYTWTEALRDPLFTPDPSCQRKPRDTRPHFGLIASGNQVVKDASFRDNLNRLFGGNVLCVEMEAAGLMNSFPCIVIRGICDYGDEQKNKDWQEYSAAISAAFAKELLQYVQLGDVDGVRPVRDVLHEVCQNTAHTRAKLDSMEDVEILDRLTPIDYGPQQSDYLSRRQPATGNWFLESERFLNWLGGGKQTLFCPGKPGAGKTILTSILIDSLNSRFGNDSKVGIAYIYFNFRRQHDQKIGNLLASVLKQLAQCCSPLPDGIKKLYNQHKSKRTRPSPHEISEILQSAASLYSRVFIIVDALDECQTTDECRTKFLLELFDLQIKHICKLFKASLSMEIHAHRDDVERYLQGHIGQLPSFVQPDKQLREEITTGILDAVDGMFLLAQLYLDLLADKVTPNDIRSTVETFQYQSQGLSDEQKGQRIDGQRPGRKTLAMNVLMWITFAKRPLTTLELRHALAVKTMKSELDPGDLPDLGAMISGCVGLVTVDEESGIIRLVHFTTQVYLSRARQPWFKDPETEITTLCVTYLSFTVFEAGLCKTKAKFTERLRLNPFYDYAACNWGRHAVSDPTSNKLVEASYQVVQMALWGGLFLRPSKRYFGLIKATDTLLRLGYSPDPKDSWKHTPLWFAAKYGHKVVLQTLLAAEADANAVDISGCSPLQAAAEGGHFEVVEQLLPAGAYVDGETRGLLPSPLQIAAAGGHLEVVERLLTANATIDAVHGQTSMTPLRIAAKRGDHEVVEKLLAAGARANSYTAAGASRSALQAAAEGGHVEVAEKLRAAGAYAHTSHGHKFMKSELWEAANGGHLEVVEKLLEVGADVNQLLSII
ncbi:hypothetical protein B0T10DRAFT_539014 [Thelonectria olida]|uniref:NACHT domain-containing protein n=1 Tax=Thelonectria olida TaxID=1576542 RepID=A0A9P8W1G8_9HYPO|nr:hypothetical protein B0T10DRAFT_539014 [Thelonectria olida]